MHFFTYFAVITDNRMIGFVQLALYLGALAGVPLCIRLSHVLEKKHLYAFSTLILGLLVSGSYFLFGEGHLFGTGATGPLLVGHALAGFFASVLWVLPASMIADITDQEELVTGQRREGAFFGLFHFGQQMATGLSLLIAGILIDDFACLQPGQAEQTPLTIHRLGTLYGLFPAALLVIAALLMLCYSLNREKITLYQHELGRLRGEP